MDLSAVVDSSLGAAGGVLVGVVRVRAGLC
jgi:hypothetical protein